MVKDIDINNLVLNRIITVMNRYDNYCADNKEFNVQHIKRDLALRLSADIRDYLENFTNSKLTLELQIVNTELFLPKSVKMTGL